MWDTSLTPIVNAITLAQAAESGGEAATPSADPSGGLIQMLPFFVLMIGLMYFFIFRPQQKRDKERREMLAALSKGDRVVTNGGVFGTIVGLNEKSVILRVSDEPLVKMEFMRGAVSKVAGSKGGKSGEDDE